MRGSQLCAAIVCSALYCAAPRHRARTFVSLDRASAGSSHSRRPACNPVDAGAADWQDTPEGSAGSHRLDNVFPVTDPVCELAAKQTDDHLVCSVE